MIFGSVCSGIEGASVAWESLGWKAAWFAEVDPFASAVLAHRWPDVPNLGDFTRIGKEVPCAAIDVLVGGTPCQSFSVAGLRAGLADPRGNLALEFLALADRLRPRWLVWENVPGALSSLSDNAPDPCPPPPPVDLELDGQEVETEDEHDAEELHALNCFVAGLSELGYGWTMRVLDAQYFGLAQRRARVFVVGHLGAWQPSAAVLLEPEGMRGDPPPSREAGEGAARPLAASARGGSGYRNDADTADNLIARPLTASAGGYRSDSETVAFHGSQDPDVSGDVTHPLGRNGGLEACVAFDETQITSPTNRCQPEPGDPCHPLAAGARPPSIIQSLGGDDAGTQEAHAIAALRILRDAVGAEAFAEWGSRILDSLQRPEILRSALHGRGIRRAAREVGAWVDDGALPRAEDLPAGTVRALWEDGPDGCSPQGRELAKQLAIELGKDLPLLPHAGASLQVRRLTPREAERLQGFPDDYTLVPVRGGMAKDGPRYRALGNSFAVPVVRWIGERIAMVDSVLADGITEGYREGA